MNKILQLIGITQLADKLENLSLFEKERFLYFYKRTLTKKNILHIQEIGLYIINDILVKIFLIAITLVFLAFNISASLNINLFLMIFLFSIPIIYLFQKTTNVLNEFGGKLLIKERINQRNKMLFNKTRLLIQSKKKALANKQVVDSRLLRSIKNRKGRFTDFGKKKCLKQRKSNELSKSFYTRSEDLDFIFND